jgi:hypothetical protein
MALSPILADFIFNDCALNLVHVSANVLKTRETCGSSIGNFIDCHLLGSDAVSSVGCVLLFQNVQLLPKSETIMEVTDRPETSIDIYQITWDLFPKEQCEAHFKAQE